jgi:hypothetical protein
MPGAAVSTLSLRGRAKVGAEWNLVAAAFNLRRLFALGVALA